MICDYDFWIKKRILEGHMQADKPFEISEWAGMQDYGDRE